MRVIIAGLIFLLCSSVYAAGYYNMMMNRGSGPTPFTWTGKTGDGNFSTAGNWYGGVVPGSSDSVIFDGKLCGTTCNATINVSITVKGMTLRSNYSGTITQASTRTITVGTIGWNQAGGTFIGSSSGDAITVNRDFVLTGGAFTSTSGNLTVVQHLTLSGSATFAHNSGTLIISTPGNFGNYAVNINSQQFNNVHFTGGPYDYRTITGTMNIDGNLVASNGDTRSNMNGGTIKVKGNVTFSNIGYQGTTLIELVGNADQLITGTASSPRFPAIKISSTGGTVFINSNLTFTNHFTYSSGTVVLSSPTITFIGAGTLVPGPIEFKKVTFINAGYDYMTLTGTMLVNEDLTFSFTDGRASITGGTFEVKGNLISSNNTFVGDTTVVLKGSTDQSISGTGQAILPSLNISSTGGTVSFLNSFKVIGNFTYTSGTVNAGTSTVAFDSTTISSGPVNFYNVKFNNGAYSYTTVSGSMTVTHDVEYAVADGRSSINGGALIVGRNITYSSSANNTNMAWVLNGSSTQTITVQGNQPAGNITVNNTSSVVTLGANLTTTASGQSITVTAGTVNMAGFNLTTRALSLNGNTITKGGGTLIVNGTAVSPGPAQYGGTVAP